MRRIRKKGKTPSTAVEQEDYEKNRGGGREELW